MDCNSPGSSVRGISQARILEWVTISSSRGSSRSRDWTCDSCVSCISGGFFTHWAIKEALWGYTPQINNESALCNPCCPPITLLVDVTMRLSSVQSLSRVWLFVTPWTAARQASPSITNSWNYCCSNLCPLSWWCHPAISYSVVPFSSWTIICPRIRWKLHENRVLLSPSSTPYSQPIEETQWFVEENWMNSHFMRLREMRNDSPKLIQLKWDKIKQSFESASS